MTVVNFFISDFVEELTFVIRGLRIGVWHLVMLGTAEQGQNYFEERRAFKASETCVSSSME